MTLPTHLIERPNMKAVHYLQSILNNDMWLECYSKDEDIDNNMSLARTQKYIKALLKSGGKLKQLIRKAYMTKKAYAVHMVMVFRAFLRLFVAFHVMEL